MVKKLSRCPFLLVYGIKKKEKLKAAIRFAFAEISRLKFFFFSGFPRSQKSFRGRLPMEALLFLFEQFRSAPLQRYHPQAWPATKQKTQINWEELPPGLSQLGTT